MNVLEYCKKNPLVCLAVIAVLIVLFIALNGWIGANKPELLEQRGLPQTGSTVSGAVAFDLGDRATDRTGMTIRDYEIEQGMLDHEFTGMSVSKPTYMPNFWMPHGPLA